MEGHMFLNGNTQFHKDVNYPKLVCTFSMGEKNKVVFQGSWQSNGEIYIEDQEEFEVEDNLPHEI